ncbi:DMT family transporter [Wolbachia endosymbiont (group A) of Sphecodes monilicornis]|uniref:DMT family transporter n=1 Tax=Wolbachia endosymbiont (group A) of Sphecodes monilicornis TaxID=2954060 RepID=UPI0022270A1A|nr:SMR family transporter [Wolbachia endosymbiont (group A) of Sphecodes monilicornis]
MNWIYLLLSSLIEVFWVITLKHSYGFTHLVPSIISIFSMALSIAFLIIVRTGHRKAESTARRKDSNRGMFFLALFFIANQ